MVPWMVINTVKQSAEVQETPKNCSTAFQEAGPTSSSKCAVLGVAGHAGPDHGYREVPRTRRRRST